MNPSVELSLDERQILRDAIDHHVMLRRADKMLGSLEDFVKAAWEIVEPGTDLVWNWHISLICDELEAVTRGECTELVICIPPGCMKSLLVSVFWPTWEWLQRPHLRALYLSNDDDLVKRDSRRRKEIVQDECYQIAVEMKNREDASIPMWGLSADQREKHYYENTKRGFHQCMSMGASVTGKRGDAQVIDDPLDAKKAVVGSSEQIQIRMEECLHVYDHVLASRMNDMASNPRVLIMQRIHHNDLAGHLIRRNVRHVVLPMEFDPDHPDKHPNDPRTEKGELLFPAKFPQAVIDKIKATPESAMHYMAQYQQTPLEASGGLFKRQWFRYYKDSGDYYECHYPGNKVRRVLKADCWRFITCDLALSEKEMASHTVIQVWDGERAKMPGFEQSTTLFLVDQWREQVEAPTVEAAMLAMWTRFDPVWFCIEDKHYGSAVIQRFQRDGLNVKKLKADRDKVTRSRIAQVWFEAEKVWLPQAAPWLGEYENELLQFPQGTWDDQVDATSYAVGIGNDRDLWRGSQQTKWKKGSLEERLGYNELLNPQPKATRITFSVDAIKERTTR
jgi:predicted phage terminase large subunit-like protein